MKEQQLIDFYWDTLKRCENNQAVLEEKGGNKTKELDRMQAISVAGLLRNGVQYHVLESQKENGIRQKKLGFLTISAFEEGSPNIAIKIILKDPDGNLHEYDAEFIRSVMHNDLDPFLVKEAVDHVQEEKNESIETQIPDLKEVMEEEIEPASVKIPMPVTIKEEKKYTDSARLPEFIRDSQYPDDPLGKKLDSTFLFNQHDITITTKSGNTGTIHFFVFPLTVKSEEPATDILAIAESGEVCRASISRGNRSSVELEFAEIPFVIRGMFENNQFISQVNLLDEEEIASVQIEESKHPATDRTSITYAQFDYQGMLLNVFPARFRNNGSTGYAPATIAIERNHTIELITPTSEGTFALNGNDGEQLCVETYWVGNENPEFRVIVSEE